MVFSKGSQRLWGPDATKISSVNPVGRVGGWFWVCTWQTDVPGYRLTVDSKLSGDTPLRPATLL